MHYYQIKWIVLSPALMWIFRKRAFSVLRDFGVFLVEEKDDFPYGQVDLEGNSIYKWYLVGFWAGRKIWLLEC